MIRITFHYRLYGQGYSETLFRANPYGPSEFIFLEDYMQKRMALMCTDGVLLAVRASNVDTPRDIIIYHDGQNIRRGTWLQPGGPTSGNPGALTNANDCTSAMLIRLSNGGANYRSFPLIGLPDDIMLGNVVDPTENANFRNRLNQWVASMAGASLGMKAQGAPTTSGRIVEFFPKTPTNPLVCLGITGPLPEPGSYVTLGNVRGFPKLNRKWRVAASGPATVDDPQFIYLAGSAGLNTFGPVQGGTWKAPSYALSILSQHTVSRATTRKGGVPFGTVRGRR